MDSDVVEALVQSPPFGWTIGEEPDVSYVPISVLDVGRDNRGIFKWRIRFTMKPGTPKKVCAKDLIGEMVPGAVIVYRCDCSRCIYH